MARFLRTCLPVSFVKLGDDDYYMYQAHIPFSFRRAKDIPNIELALHLSPSPLMVQFLYMYKVHIIPCVSFYE